MSTLEEVAISTVAPMMAVAHNLVLFDQHVPRNTLQSIVPDLATDWSWNEDGTQLTFRLRRGVRWHDVQPFTAKDVQCTWDMLLGRSAAKFRINPRRSTIPISNSTRATPAIPTAISPDTATAGSRSFFTSRRARPVRRSASRWSGTSTQSCRRKERSRSSFIPAAQPAGISQRIDDDGQ